MPCSWGALFFSAYFEEFLRFFDARTSLPSSCGSAMQSRTLNLTLTHHLDEVRSELGVGRALGHVERHLVGVGVRVGVRVKASCWCESAEGGSEVEPSSFGSPATWLG